MARVVMEAFGRWTFHPLRCGSASHRGVPNLFMVFNERHDGSISLCVDSIQALPCEDLHCGLAHTAQGPMAHTVPFSSRVFSFEGRGVSVLTPFHQTWRYEFLGEQKMDEVGSV